MQGKARETEKKLARGENKRIELNNKLVYRNLCHRSESLTQKTDG